MNRERQKERLAVLQEIIELLDQLAQALSGKTSQSWLAAEALRDVRAEVVRRAEATLEAYRASGVCSCGDAMRALGQSSPHCHVHWSET